MKWSAFGLFVAILIMGNVLVHAQGIPSLPSTPNIPTTIPDQALESLNVPPGMFSKLPTEAQREATRRQNAIRDEILQSARDQNPVAHGGIPLSSNTGDTSQSPTPSSDLPGSDSSSAGTNDSTPPAPEEQGQSSLSLANSYLSTDHALTQANIAQTLALATDADIRLWKGYYDDMYDHVTALKRSYEHVRDSLRRYKDRVSSMLSRLPATIFSCTR